MSSTQTDWRALCGELLEAWDAQPLPPYQSSWAGVVSRARALLAQPEHEVARPTQDELWELWLRLDRELLDRPVAVAAFWEHAQVEARSRFGRPAPAPAGEVCKEEIDCETCEGSGTIDETLGGYGDSNQAATCPDCDGIGVITVPATLLTPAGELIQAYQAGRRDAEAESQQAAEAADLLERQAAPVPVAVSERLPELRGMFERILCVARSSDQRPVGNIELADRLIKAVVSWGALPLPSGEVGK